VSSINFISDIHGEFKKFREWTKTMDYSLQLGDMGLGFPKDERDKYFVKDLNHRWIRGNHDDPAVCRMKPNYLGDYGFCEEQNMTYEKYDGYDVCSGSFYNGTFNARIIRDDKGFGFDVNGLTFLD